MIPLVLDTNIVSYVMDNHSLTNSYQPYLDGNALAISFMTVAELYQGAVRAHWGKKRVAEMERTIGQYVHLQSSIEMCQWWATVRAQRRQQPISVQDAWIAATALAYDCALVTHNPSDFRGIAGLRVTTVAQN